MLFRTLAAKMLTLRLVMTDNPSMSTELDARTPPPWSVEEEEEQHQHLY